MGSQALQGKLWGQQPADWSEIQEPTSEPGYNFVLNFLSMQPGAKLLDIGCGSGYFSKMAKDAGASVTSIDATPELLAKAQKRVAGIDFNVGEMEELPFEDNSFDVVCGFNSFQYATDTKNALNEAKRVLKPGGKLVAMIWGTPQDCEAVTYLKAMGSLMPPPPPGAPGPFALTENHRLETILEELGLKILNSTDVECVWDYPDKDTAMKGLLSAGPATRAIEHSGFDKVYFSVSESMQPYIQNNGRVFYRNKFRAVIAEK
jgi:SAM-dependent methyltransferase